MMSPGVRFDFGFVQEAEDPNRVGAIARFCFSGRRRTRRSGSRTGRSTAPTGTSSACTTLEMGSPGKSRAGDRESRAAREIKWHVQRVPSPVLYRVE